MAALTHRGTEATYTVHERISVHTSDRQDHTFCGVMFPVECKKILPVENVVITSLSIRGQLGPLTVWISKDPDEKVHQKRGSKRNIENDLKTASVARSSFGSKHKATHTMNTRSKTGKYQPKQTMKKDKFTITADPSEWIKIYDNTLSPSLQTYKKLDLSGNPIYLKPGQVRGIYVHSTLDNDRAIVYDNYLFNDPTEIPQDSFIRLRPAMAHVSTKPFGRKPIWGGGMGQSWRRDRKFVGKIEYGVIYRLWNPKEHLFFGSDFQNLALQLFACQRRSESPMSRLPDDCIFYILNMCKWDWVGDNLSGMKLLLDKRKAKESIASKKEAEEDDRKVQAKESDKDKKKLCRQTNHFENDETNDIDYDDEVDYESEVDMEVDAEYDEDWDSDSDDDDLYRYDYRNPVLYREGENFEPIRPQWARSRLRNGNNRQFVLGNFMAAFMLAGSGEDNNDVELSSSFEYDDDL